MKRLLVLSAAAVVFSLPSPLNPQPFQLLSNPSVKQTSGGENWACADLVFTNSWKYDSTHWSAYLRVPAALAFTHVGAANYTVDESAPNTARLFASPWDAVLKAGQKKSFSFCVQHEQGEDMPAVDSKMLLVLDVQNPPSPLEFSQGTSTPKPIANDCFTNITYPSEFDLFSAGNVYLSSSSVDGRIASAGLVTISKLYSRLGTSIGGFCNVQCGNADSDVTLVANNVSWLTTPGLCGGFQVKYRPVVANSILENIDAGCTAQWGSLPFDINEKFPEIQRFSENLITKPFTGNVAYSNSNLRLIFTETTGNPAVFYVPGQMLSDNGFSELQVLNPQFITSDTIIILNVGGQNIEWNLPAWTPFSQIPKNVIFNFYEANHVYVKKSLLYGSIIAPYGEVDVNTGSTVFGNIYARSIIVSESQIYSLGKFVGFSRLNGKCLFCEPGFYGSRCQACTCGDRYNCQDGVLGSGQCVCKPGFNADCNECLENRFGPLCNQTCSSSCLSRGKCDWGISGSGTCSDCVSPFNGTQCDDCVYGYFGNDCQNVCTDTCLERGTCLSGSKGTGLCVCRNTTGYGGNQCDVCDQGHYGDNCQFSCSSTCARHGKCDNGFNGTGACLSCKPQFRGAECQYCAPGLWGESCENSCTQSCLLYGQCDEGQQGSGSCSNCKSLVRGLQCEKCASTNAYGTSCEKVCNCSEGGVCDDGPLGTGKCICKSGYSGPTCAKRRSNGASPIQLSWLVALLVLSLIVCV